MILPVTSISFLSYLNFYKGKMLLWMMQKNLLTKNVKNQT